MNGTNPEWDHVLSAAARLQELVPDAVLVGGTAAAQHAGHRVSFDDDHVLADLRDRFDQLLDDLESTDGWITARTRRPVLILGSLDGVETGIRQLIRRRPLEVESMTVPSRGTICVPTLEEMARIKAWLVLKRNATRDYLDVIALADRLGDAAAGVLAGIDDYYGDQIGPGGQRVSTQLARQLAEPLPYDLSEVDLDAYRRLDARWQDWNTVAAECRELATAMLDRVARGERP
ncbi:MAG: hypothetical protein WD627_11820 [Actinomycetota bacterium]